MINSVFRLQNSPYFCVFKYARVVQLKVWNEAENRERDLERDVTDFEKKNRLFCSLLCLKFFVLGEKKGSALAGRQVVTALNYNRLRACSNLCFLQNYRNDIRNARERDDASRQNARASLTSRPPTPPIPSHASSRSRVCFPTRLTHRKKCS